MDKWIVILNSPHGPVPLMDINENMAVYDDEMRADREGRTNPLGGTFGYEVFRWTWDVPEKP